MRKSTSQKLALFVLFSFLFQLAAPTLSYALTFGPGQKEYVTYESAGSRDMVSLLTGDLNVNIPLLEVPGPEGGITVPLFYHSGIGVFDESSWVGLGWNINLGAIARNVVGYPDDYVGHIGITPNNAMNIRTYQAGGRSYTTDYFFYQRYWDSENGYQGRISLFSLATISSDGGLSGVNDASVLGIHHNNKGFSVNPDEFAIGVSNAISIASSIAGPIGVSASTANVVASVGMQLAMMTAAGFVSIAQSKGNLGGSVGFFSFQSNKTRWNKVESRWWFEYNQDEWAYGSLYMGKASNPPSPATMTCAESDIATTSVPSQYNTTYPKFKYTLNNGSGSMVNIGTDMHVSVIASSYHDNRSPSSITYDGYSVSGPGVSGNISPYRMDVGTVATQKRTSFTSCKLNFIPFVDEDVHNYKVQFRYPGIPSNSIRHHRGIDNVGNLKNSENLDVLVGGYNYSGPYTRMYHLFHNSIGQINDYVKNNSYIKKRQSFGRNVEWFSNEELKNVGVGSPTLNGQIIDFIPFAQRNSYRSALPQKGIGGFAITAEDGTTYHYSLPVYNLRDFEIKSSIQSQATSYAYKVNPDRYATTWLLTAITGPDFVDRGELGYIDDDGRDYGYWVKFEYGKFASTYQWRLPYYDAIRDKSNIDQGYVNGGTKETYYLNTIKTKTHTAVFIKDVKNDGKGFYGWHQIDPNIINVTKNGVTTNINSFTSLHASSSMLLKEIALFKNSDYNYLLSQGLTTVNASTYNTQRLKTSATGCTFDNVYDIEDFAGTKGQMASSRMLKGVRFLYDYSLCPGTPNSFASLDAPDTKTGKLTLKGLQFLGRDYVKLFPDYTFNYGYHNPSFGYLAFDGWGMFNSSNDNFLLYGTKATTNTAEHTAWNLSSMVTPTGTTVSFDLERDTYTNISGVLISSIISGNTWKYGGDVRVKTITVSGDGGTEYKTRYLYDQGTVAKEPEYDRMWDPPLFKAYDYPFTPVLYGNVKVLTGKLSTNNDYESMSEYSFVTPSMDFLSITNSDYYRGPVVANNSGDVVVMDHLRENFSIKSYNSQIGKVKWMKSYNKGGTVSGETIFNYTHTTPDQLGVYTEGTFMGEVENDNPGSRPSTYRLFRTCKTFYPTLLESVVNKKNGMTVSTSTIDAYDFISGLPIKRTYTNTLGSSITSMTIPAYAIYPDMGSKGANITNKNMLSQEFANFSYLSGDPNKVIGATMQTWSKEWTYRMLSAGQYTDVAPTNNAEKVYRKKASYVWKTDNLNNDGTFPYPLKDLAGASLTENNYLNCTGCKWLKGSEVTRYDNHSRTLESKDVNGNYASSKYGLDHMMPISSSSFSTYNSSFHTSFEDLDANGWFGGEVGGMNVYTTHITNDGSITPHTGKYMVKVAGGTNIWGPMCYYKTGTASTSGIEPGRTYRASVWVHANSDPNAALFFSYNGNVVGSVEKKLNDASAVVATVGNWKLVRLDVTLPANYTSSGSTSHDVRVGVKGGTSLPSYFDDLRLHPIESSISGITYDEQGRVEYVLNQDNFFTRNVYNARGALIEVYQETPTKGVRKVKEYSQHFQGE